MVGCFNITASLDHLDYDCIVVAGSVHVLRQCAKGLPFYPLAMLDSNITLSSS